MKRLFILILITVAPRLALSRVVPTGIAPNQLSDLSQKFSGLLSLNSSNSPFALGEDLEFELTGIYQDFEVKDLTNAIATSNTKMLEATGTIRKGLYYNIDISFTFALPMKSHMASGHLFSLSHSSKILGLLIKPEVYISNYNIDDILHLNTSGLSLLAFKKIGVLYLGLGGRVEFVESDYEKSFLGSNNLTSSSAKTDIIYSTGLIKIITRLKRIKFSGTYSISDKNHSGALSMGMLF